VAGRAQVAVYIAALTPVRGALEHNGKFVKVSTNVTVEVGWAAPEFASVRVAVKFTGWFTVEGDCEELTATVKGCTLTI
jgi:hypothetical protein